MFTKTLVASMKNEGPFILEWIAYHRAIGFDNILIGSNDCGDRSDELLDALALEGFISHRKNKTGPNDDPQHAFLRGLQDHHFLSSSDWIMVLDADEFVNIRVGAGHIDDLLSLAPRDADALVLLWKNFGDAGLTSWTGGLVTEKFTRCETKIERHNRFHKTIFRNNGKFDCMNAHYPHMHWAVRSENVNIYNTEFAQYRLVIPEGKFYFESVQQDESLWTWGNAYVNHYPFKTEDLFWVKRNRGDNVPGRADEKYAAGSWYYRLRANNDALDDSLLHMRPHIEKELATLRKSALIRDAEARMLDAFDSLRTTVLANHAAKPAR